MSNILINTSKPFTIRTTKSSFEALDTAVKQTGLNRAFIVDQALRSYFGLPVVVLVTKQEEEKAA